ncbi:hypothetical protein BT96DRAFT_158534 [Gymnopus androsaceus JB14]|uniref:Uncharacterized protein n=1 Tax=Gymnopus androsaceus JB14 TaxID=1447944 RepID=A0A6A4HAH9_9AGAR|nr:hypothetical protein BT96DRAFT_158534 [Gymnopus androsaceus JB14]
MVMWSAKMKGHIGDDTINGDCSSALSCSYTFNYTAPALRCTDLPSTAIGNGVNASSGLAIVLEHWYYDDTDNLAGFIMPLQLSTGQHIP